MQVNYWLFMEELETIEAKPWRRNNVPDAGASSYLSNRLIGKRSVERRIRRWRDSGCNDGLLQRKSEEQRWAEGPTCFLQLKDMSTLYLSTSMYLLKLFEEKLQKDRTADRSLCCFSFLKSMTSFKLLGKKGKLTSTRSLRNSVNYCSESDKHVWHGL